MMDTSSSQEKCPNYCDCHPGTGRSRACRGGDDTRKRCSIRRKNNQIKGKFLGEIGHQAPGCCCSVTKSCLTLCNPMNCSTPDLPVPHDLPEFAQIHVHCHKPQLSGQMKDLTILAIINKFINRQKHEVYCWKLLEQEKGNSHLCHLVDN